MSPNLPIPDPDLADEPRNSLHGQTGTDPDVALKLQQRDGSADLSDSVDREGSRNPVDLIAEEFAGRLRQGQHPRPEDYFDRYPEFVDDLRDVLPTVALLESSKANGLSVASDVEPDPELTTGGGSSRQSASSTLRVPERLGDYQLIREIGRGGMGVVYEARQESLGRRVAIKILPTGRLADPRQVERFRRESRAAAQLHHTNIVPIFGTGEDPEEGLHYFVMQYISGKSLDRVLDDLRSGRPVTFSKSDSGLEAERRAQAEVLQGEGSQPHSDAIAQAPRPLEDLDQDVEASDLTIDHPHQPASTPQPDPDETVDLPATPSPALASRLRLVSLDRSSSGQRAATGSTQARVSEDSGNASAMPPGSGTLAPVREAQGLTVLKPGTPGYWRCVGCIGYQAASALEYAHAMGTLHRDIKPGNLLFDRAGVVWIADFGLAKLHEQDDLTGSGDLVGTLRYMAPERLNGQIDARSEVYGLGLTLYELACLRPAFEASDQSQLLKQIHEHNPPRPRQHNGGIPQDLETIILKAMAYNPADRYPSAAAMADDLHRFLQQRPVRARRITPWERGYRWVRRNPLTGGLAIAVAVLFLSVAGVSTAGYLKIQAQNHQIGLAMERTKAQMELADDEKVRANANLGLALQAFEKILDRLQVQHQPDDEVNLAHGNPLRPLTEEDQSVLEVMLEFYELFAQSNRENSEIQRSIAEASRYVAQIHQRMNQFDQAIAWYRRALKEFDDTPRVLQNDPKARLVRAACHRELATLRSVLGQRLQAEPDFRRAEQLLIAGCSHYPDSAEIHCAYAETQSSWSDSLYHQGHLRAARQRLVKALEVLRRVEVPSEGSGQRIHYVKAAVTGQLAAIDIETALSMAQHLDAFALRNRAIALLRQLRDEAIQADSANQTPEYDYQLAKLLITLPDELSRYRLDPFDLDRDAIEAVGLAKDLYESYPQVPAYRSLLGQAFRRSADLLCLEAQRDRDSMMIERIEEHLDEAIQHATRAISLARRLVTDFPEVATYRLRLAEALFTQGGIFDERDQVDLAQTYYREAQENLVQFREEATQNRDGLHLLQRLQRVLQETGENDLIGATGAE